MTFTFSILWRGERGGGRCGKTIHFVLGFKLDLAKVKYISTLGQMYFEGGMVVLTLYLYSDGSIVGVVSCSV